MQGEATDILGRPGESAALAVSITCPLQPFAGHGSVWLKSQSMNTTYPRSLRSNGFYVHLIPEIFRCEELYILQFMQYGGLLKEKFNIFKGLIYF